MTIRWWAAKFALPAVETNTWGTALEQLRNYFNLELWGGLLTTLAAVWWMSAIYLRRRGTQVRKVDSPRRLLRELIRGHRLSWSETALIQQLAEARDLDDAALLFVREDYFELHDLDGDVCTKRAAVQKLREKLFANSEIGARNSEPETEAAESTAMP